MWLRLKNIQLYAYHGVHAHEREHGGRFEIDVELRKEFDSSVAGDRLENVINYVELATSVNRIASSTKYNLIESLADAIASNAKEEFDADEVVVRVRKPGASVGVTMESVEIEVRR